MIDTSDKTGNSGLHRDPTDFEGGISPTITHSRSKLPLEAQRKIRLTAIKADKSISSVRSSEKPRRKQGAFTLNDMLKNAKVVEKTYVEPYEKMLLDDGVLPSSYMDNYMEGITNKFQSFHRKLDDRFNRLYGEKYHNFRQSAWKDAKKDYNKRGTRAYIGALKSIRGPQYAVPNDVVLLSDKHPEGTFMDTCYKVSLIPAQWRYIQYSDYDNMLLASGKMGNAKTSIWNNELKYRTKYESDFHIRHISELEELRYIYRSFHYLSRMSNKSWLNTLLRHEDQIVLDYNLGVFTHPDGIWRQDNMVYLEVEGYSIEVTVDTLFEWIEWTRLPKKEYAIGEPESELLVYYALLLSNFGADKQSLKENLTLEMINEGLEAIDLVIAPKLNPERDWEGEDDIENNGLILNTINIDQLNSAIDTYEQTNEIISSMPNFDDIVDMEEEDDFESDSDDAAFSDVQSEPDYEIQLPYNPNLHQSNEEYESLLNPNLSDSEEEEVNDDNDETLSTIEWSENASQHSDNLPDQAPDELERLGIDLIDNRDRSVAQNPSQRRIEMLWGSAQRRPIRRFKGKPP